VEFDMYLKPIALFASILTLTACGGGGGGGGSSSPGSASGSSDPVYRTLTASSGNPTVATLKVTPSQVSTEAGSSAFTSSSKSFTQGGNAVTTATSGLTSGMQYVAGVAIAPANISNADGVRLVAEQTQSGDVPTNTTLTYSGNADVRVNDGTNAYEGNMSATITARVDGAGAGTVDVVMSNPTNTMIRPASGTLPTSYTPSGREHLALTGAVIDGASFAQGADTEVEAHSWNGASNVNIISGTQQISADGVFAGPDAAEAAVVATARGATGGSATFTAAGTKQ
jgi:hypothetical protein